MFAEAWQSLQGHTRRGVWGVGAGQSVLHNRENNTVQISNDKKQRSKIRVSTPNALYSIRKLRILQVIYNFVCNSAFKGKNKNLAFGAPVSATDSNLPPSLPPPLYRPPTKKPYNREGIVFLQKCI